MGTYGIISSIETLPAPEGMHVRDFDAVQKARKLNELAAKRSADAVAATSGHLDPKSHTDMSYQELDSAIDTELVASVERMIPYLLEMKRLLSQQGARTDRGVPQQMTWQKWVESKKELIGSIRTVNRMLAEEQKEPCGNCGRKSGHLKTCLNYVKPNPKKLTALEKKFVDSSVKQHDVIKDFYAGHADAEMVIQSIAKVLPTHERLTEYLEHGSEALEKLNVAEGDYDVNELIAEIERLNVENDKLEKFNENLEKFAELKISEDELEQRLEDQSFCMGREKEEEISRLKAEHELAKQHITDNFQKRFETLEKLPTAIRDQSITTTLEAEPDTNQASTMLTLYLQSVALRVMPPHMALSSNYANVTLIGRDHRIMVGDYLEHTTHSEQPTLCKCVAIGDFMSRRRIREWGDDKWGKEHTIFSSDESRYRVITEMAARVLAPDAFGILAPEPSSMSAAESEPTDLGT
jgi:hypothetical protein